MGRMSISLHLNVHSHNSDNKYLLLDFAIFIHVFHNKNRLTTFKKTTKG